MKQKYASLQKYAKIKGIAFVFGREEYSKAILVPKRQKTILKKQGGSVQVRAIRD